MTDTLKALIADPTIAAVTFRQTLQPIEGKDTPVFPATYPAPERGQHRFDTPDTIHAAMLAYANGQPEALAKLCPTALIYGAWDSRDTRVKIPRAIRSEIRAFDVALLTRSAQFSGTFDANDLELTAQEWKKGADAGFAPTPSVDAHGGVLVHGEIVHTASILLTALRRYRGTEHGELLSLYLLGLALSGLIHATRDYGLRSGCWLVPDGAADWQQVHTDGTREGIDIDPDALAEEVKTTAATWADAVGVTLGGEPQLHDYDPKAGKRMVKAKETA